MPIEAEYVRQRLARKRELDPECIGFGVEAHRYQLQPPIKEKKLRRLEAKHHIALPEDYKNFLLNIGNGGAGPSYGLYSLEGALTGLDSTYPQGRGDVVGTEISRDFIRPDEVESSEWPDETGILKLCQHGCANDDYLVVCGKEHGTVWRMIEWAGHLVPLLKEMPELTDANSSTLFEKPEAEHSWLRQLLDADRSEQMSFTDWYIKWLEAPPKILPDAKKRRDRKKRFRRLKRFLHIR